MGFIGLVTSLGGANPEWPQAFIHSTTRFENAVVNFSTVLFREVSGYPLKFIIESNPFVRSETLMHTTQSIWVDCFTQRSACSSRIDGGNDPKPEFKRITPPLRFSRPSCC